MDSGRKRLASGIESRRHSRSPERQTIIWMSATSGHTVLTAERFSSCSDRQAKPFGALSPGSGNQFPLPNALQCACTGLPMVSRLTSLASYIALVSRDPLPLLSPPSASCYKARQTRMMLISFLSFFYLASCRPPSLNHCHYVVFCLRKAVEQGQELGLWSMAHYHEQHHHHHFRQCQHYSLQGRKTGS